MHDHGRGARAAGLLAVVGMLGTLTVTASSTWAGELGYFGGVGGGVVLALMGARRRSGRARGAWLLVAAGLAASALADVVWELDVARLGQEPDASIADVAYLASYLLLALGVHRVGAEDSGRHDPLDVVLDSAMAGVLALLAVWQVSLAGILGDTESALWLRALWSAYPILDVVLLTLVIRLVLRRASPAGTLLAAGVGAWLVADVGFMLSAGDGVVSPWLDLGWMLASVLMGVAALADTGSHQHRPAPSRSPWLGPVRVALTTLPLLVPATLDVLARLTGHEHPDPYPMLAATVAMAALVYVRLRHAGHAVARSRNELQARERRARALAAHASDAGVVLSPGATPLSEASGVAAFLDRLTGPADPAVTDLATRMGGDDPHRVHRLIGRALAVPSEVVLDEWPLDTPDGGTAWVQARAVSLVDQPDVGGVVVNLHDVTPRKQAEEELTRQALYDSLTGLANRVLFRERLDHAVRGRRRGEAPPVVLYLDLDGFKTVNDSLGHDAGDEMLREVAARLVEVVRAGDTVARLGGDEFAVLVETTNEPVDEAQTVASRILQSLSTPVRVRERSVAVSASIGIALHEVGDTATSMLRNADVAMYEAKSGGRSRAVVFEPGMQTAADERLQLELDLASALPEDQLRLVYQPVVDLPTGDIVGLEALVRWQHPTLGLLRPDRFVSIAEDCGLIVPIGRWVLDTACAALAAWRSSSPRWDRVTMAVNVSARQVTAPSFVEEVASVLDRWGLPASSLVIEMTESVLVEDVTTTTLRMHALRDLGVRLAVDDFGTGYSSLGYLRQFPLDILKIDRSFTATIVDGGEVPPLVRGLLDLAAMLGLETIAEGIEDEVQSEALRRGGCHLGQGYLLGAPLPASVLRNVMAQERRTPHQAAATPNRVPIR